MNPVNSSQSQPDRASPNGSPKGSPKPVPHEASPSPSGSPTLKAQLVSPKQNATGPAHGTPAGAQLAGTPAPAVAAAVPAAVMPLKAEEGSAGSATANTAAHNVKSSHESPAGAANASPSASASAGANTSVGAPAQGAPNQKCANCGAVSTPLWRRGLKGEIMCNACGLYVKSRNVSRPTTLNRAPNTRTIDEAMGSCPGGGQCNGMGGAQACGKCPTFNNRVARSKQTTSNNPQVAISCQNCGTVTTPLWRRDNEGNTICNACGLYLRMHHEHRPVQMLKNTIKRRRRGDEEKSPRATHSPAPIDFNQEPPTPLPAPAMAVASPMSMPQGQPQGQVVPFHAQGHPQGHPQGHVQGHAPAPQAPLHQGHQGSPQLGRGVPQGAQLPGVVGSQGPHRQGPQGLPQGVPQGVHQGLPQGPQGLAQGVPPGLPQGPQGVPQGLPAGVTGPAPGLYQPLSLLSYLSGDSKKEYLLAVRRQLQDKAAQCEAQLKQYIEHLRQCDEAINESEL